MTHSLPAFYHAALDQEALDALETSASLSLEVRGELVSCPIWLVRTADQLVLVAAADATHHQTRRWLLEGLSLRHHSGLLRDEIELADQRLPLPMGAGKKAAAFVEAAQPGAKEGEAPASPQEQSPGSLWQPALPDAVQAALGGLLEPGELLLGYSDTNSLAQRPAAPWWFVLTDRRCGLLAAEGGALPLSSWRQLGQQVELRCQRRLTRDSFQWGEEELFEGPLVGAAELRRLVEMAALPPARRLAEAASEHITRKRHGDALALLDAAEQATGPEQVELLAWSKLRRAQVHWLRAESDQALLALTAAAALQPQEDRIEASQGLGLGKNGWWLLLATALRQAGGHAAAARVWGRAREEEPKQDIYVLEQARALREAQEAQAALACYRTFLERRQGQGTFALVEATPDAEGDPELSGCDPERAAALLEQGLLHQQLQSWEEATDAFLQVVREAPWWTQGHRHLFQAAEHLPQAPAAVGRAALILRLVRPDLAQALEEELGPLPSPPAPLPLPTRYQPMDEAQHKASLHPREGDISAQTQRWVGKLVSENQDTGDIRRHCQRLEATTWPQHRAVLTEVAGLLGLPTPACYISHGATGIQALGQEKDAFLLLGASHLDPSQERHLGLAPFCFAVASQMAHIRAGHLLLTNSEFWTAFGHKALDAGMTLLSLVPAASWLGKLDTVAQAWVAALQKRFEGDAVRKLLSAAQEQAKQGAVGAGAQDLLGRALSQARQSASPQVPHDSLIKEQLASFARGALYSADRLGLLACDDLEAALEAIFKLSPQAVEEWPGVQRHGLAHALARRTPQGQLRYQELALRLGELFRFALSPAYEALRELHLPDTSEKNADSGDPAPHGID